MRHPVQDRLYVRTPASATGRRSASLHPFVLALLILVIAGVATLIWRTLRTDKVAPDDPTAIPEIPSEPRESVRWPTATSPRAEIAMSSPRPREYPLGLDRARRLALGESPAVQTERILSAIRHTGPTEAAWATEAAHSLRRLADSADDSLRAQLSVAEVECYAGGCFAVLRYRDLTTFQRANDRFMRDPRSPFNQWSGIRQRTSPATALDGTVTSAWVLTPGPKQASEVPPKPKDNPEIESGSTTPIVDDNPEIGNEPPDSITPEPETGLEVQSN
jgi:hypothetical protein